MQVNTYAQVTEWILNKAVTLKDVNFAGEGDIYSINSMECTNYPLIWASAVRPASETENYWVYNITLYYIDRLKDEVEDINDANSVIARSNGIIALSRLINAIRNADWCLDIGYDNTYTQFGNTFVFNDYCTGVYTEIMIKVPKATIC